MTKHIALMFNKGKIRVSNWRYPKYWSLVKSVTAMTFKAVPGQVLMNLTDDKGMNMGFYMDVETVDMVIHALDLMKVEAGDGEQEVAGDGSDGEM